MKGSILMKLGVLVGMILMFSCGAMADTILTLNPEAFHTVGPQSTSAPCVIAGTNCQNPAGFDFDNFKQKGSLPAYDELSPVYDIADFPFLQFNVAIDVNTTKAEGEILDLFEVFLGNAATGTRIYHYDGPGPIGQLSDNGNGFADWTLRSIDLSTLSADQTIQFHAVWHDASDGAESFFLVSTTTPPPTVPEPGSLILLGSGLLGLALYARKRNSD